MSISDPNHFEAPSLLKLHKVPRAHLVGIAGAGMRSLAEVLFSDGWEVCGSDSNCGDFSDPRFKIRAGHEAQWIDSSLDLVVYSAAVPRTNPELRRARQLGLRTLSYPQMLGRLMASRQGVAIAGTHGKSTTTAMAAEILSVAGTDPTVIFGAVPLRAGRGNRLGRGRWMLAEACEYRSNFRYLKPQLAVILNIEPDHFDCFRSQLDLERAFRDFACRVPRDGLILAHADCAATQSTVADVECASESFGLGPTATWRASGLCDRRGLYSFQIRCQDRLVCDVNLQVPGRHNVLNALAASALASHCGASGTAIRAGLERFIGLARRLELISHAGDVTVFDDYAHHPTEIIATLASLRQMAPGRRLWCVFQPHQASRTKRLLDEFAHSLQNADKIIVTEVYRAREGPFRPGEVTAADLARRVAARGLDVIQLRSAADIQTHLQNSLRPGDVLVTMGAGDIGKIAHDVGKGTGTFRQAG